MLDLHTFGKSKAAQHLVVRLNELDRPSMNRYVTNFLIGRNRLTSALSEMDDRKARLTFARLLRDNINSATIKDAPEIIQSLAKNVAIGAIKAKILCDEGYDVGDYYIDVSGHEFDFEPSATA